MVLIPIFLKRLQVILFVFIVEKNIGTVITSLGYMMGIFGCYDSGYSRHIKLPLLQKIINVN